MIIHYQNTYAEFIEASEASAVRRSKKHRGEVWILAAAFAAYGLTCGAVSILMGKPFSLQTDFDLWFPLIALSAIFFFLILFKLARSKVRGVRLRATISLVLFCLSIGWVITGVALTGSPNSRSSPRLTWLVPHIGWLFVMTSLTIFIYAIQRAHKISLWESETSFHRAKTADISVDGVVLTDAATRNEMRWESFAGWTETKTLIVLFPSDYRVIFFPKRAFKSAEELAAMRVLASRISPARPSAFPVVPAENPVPPQVPMPPPLPGAPQR
jgi:hypothetical protein